MVGILLSFWDGLFSGAMLVSGRVGLRFLWFSVPHLGVVPGHDIVLVSMRRSTKSRSFLGTTSLMERWDGCSVWGSLRLCWGRCGPKAYVPGSKLPLFPYNRGWSSNPLVGIYIPIIRIPIKGGMTIPNIATFDHGTYKATRPSQTNP